MCLAATAVLASETKWNPPRNAGGARSSGAPCWLSLLLAELKCTRGLALLPRMAAEAGSARAHPPGLSSAAGVASPRGACFFCPTARKNAPHPLAPLAGALRLYPKLAPNDPHRNVHGRGGPAHFDVKTPCPTSLIAPSARKTNATKPNGRYVS